jgi:hypothetical protein
MNMKATLYEAADKLVERGVVAKKATVCPVPYRWPKRKKPGGLRLRLSSMENGQDLKYRCLALSPAPANNFCASS